MRRFYIALLSFLFTVSLLFAQDSYRVPDFAFPTQVESRSDSLLSVYLKLGDQTMALRETMNLCIANAMLDDELSVKNNISLIDSIIPELRSPYSNLAYLLEAEVLQQEYSSNSGLYNSRNLPLDEPYPVDPMDWSGEMFQNRIYQLVDSATCNLQRITDKPQILIHNSPLFTDTQDIGLTVTDFILFKGASLLNSNFFPKPSSLIPFYPAEEENTIEGKCSALAQSLLNILSQSENPIVRALAIRDSLSFVADSQKETYLEDAVSKLKYTEGGGLLLYELWTRYGRDSNSCYSEINEWLKSFPEGFAGSLLRYALSEMNQERMEVQFPKMVLPNSPVSGNVMVTNLKKGYILIYKLSQSQFTAYDELILKKFNTSSRPVYILEVEEEGTVPYQYNKEILIPSLSEGLYAIIPSKSKSLPKNFSKATFNSNVSTIRVSDISIITACDSNEEGSGKVYVVNAHDQRPVAGATVTYYKGDNKNPVKKLVTNSEGWVSVPTGYYRIEASYGKSVAKTEAGFNYNPVKNVTQYHTSILTDLAVYHPGDTVRFAVIGWKQDNTVNSLVKNTPMEVSLRDANYIRVNSDTITLNEEGRASGFFVIPKGRLLGSYILSAGYPDEPSRVEGFVNILVEDYKLPSFLVTLEQLETPMPDMLRFKGVASTFTGMPVTDANVNLEVNFVPWRWGLYGPSASYFESLETGPDGSFEVTLPLDGLKDTPFEKGRYSITADVTSPAGESQKSSPLFFYLGNACDIRPAISDKVEIKGDSVKLHIPVYDMAGLPIKTMVDYRFINIFVPSDTIYGNFLSPSLSIPSKKIPVGKYRLEFKTPENAAWTSTETVFFNCSDKVPYPTPLWVPLIEYSYSHSDNTVNVSFGSYYPDWLLYILSDGEKVMDTKWLAPSDSLLNFDIEIPEGNPTLFVTLMGMHDFESAYGVIKIVPSKSLEKLSVESSSFRSDISAGDQEDWTFKFSVNGTPAPFVNAFAVLSDKALNSIRNFKWNLNIWDQGIYPKVRVNSRTIGNAFSSFSYRTFSNFLPYPNFNLNVIPGWQTYNYPLVSSSGLRFGGAVLYKSMATRNVMSDSMVESAKVAEAEDEAVVETGQISNDIQQDEQLRPVEMPLAFFMPDLKADEQGDLSIKFTVPNYNTTWQLQVAGYNDEMLNTTLMLDAVAAKPVMIKSNLPQYLRTGDKAEISATIFNNSEERLPVGGRIEILNAVNGEILSSERFPALDLGPSANRVVSIKYAVPDTLSLIAVRAYAEADRYSDGEQGFLPILPSSTPVVESFVFYGEPDWKTIKSKLSKLPKDANITVKYNDNPLWDVLLSLPDLKDNNNGGSLSIANWLYSTLTSINIIHSNPNISEGLRKILESEDSTLTMSNLEKDQSLKISALETTPWINNAYGETARIRNLSRYLDPSDIEPLITSKTEALRSLQKFDGGFSWFEDMKSSPYITSQIIGVLGYLNQRNILSEQLHSVARKAVKYYDSYVEDQAKKSKSYNALSLLDYLYSRNMLDFSKSSELKKLESQCCDSIVKQWKYWSPGQKAKGAILLLANGHDKEVNIIAESIQEFLNTRISLDQEAIILDFFNKFNPQSKAIDTLREKMFLQKETTSWSSLPNAAGIIYVLLSTYDSQLPINPGVSWGAVITQYVLPIRDVKAVKSENISIEKHVYMEDAKGKVKEVKDFRKGVKVTVVLNITCLKDMDYVAVVDSRSACLQPEEQVSGPVNVDGLYAYREFRSDKTFFFIEKLPAGKYVISYDCYVDRAGTYSLGIATVQSLYSPSQTAHSSGTLLNSKP
ncbi:MAG: hypothetical protein J1E16_12015 [Muribaculaceae bacterium]|nr:hypothetical protein [Muribaculaceae bacterium]